MRASPRVTRVVGATALALSLISCGGGGGSTSGGGAPNPSGIVSSSWTDPQNPLEPANTNEVQGGKVLNMIFRGLKQYDPRTAEAKNLVAQSITTSDQQNFTITLKSGWKFSDGTPVNSKSFVDAWNYGALLTNRQINAPFFSYIDGYAEVHPDSGSPKAQTMSGLQVVDDSTFTVKLTQKFTGFPVILGYAAFYPLPQAFYSDHAAWLKKPVGNGPYQVDSYTRGQGMKLVKWDGYNGPDKAKNGGVQLKVYTDNNTAYTDLQAGNLDVLDDIPASQLPNVKSDLGSRYINQPAGIFQSLSFPMYRSEWGSKDALKLRQGLSMAIDRAQITKSIFMDTRTPASDWTSPVLKEAGGYKQGVCGSPCTYDPKQAKKLIDEAGGLPGGKVTISSNVDTGSHRVWMDAVCNSINNAMGNDKACVVNPVSTFADFRKQVVAKQMNGMFRTGWQMDYPLIQDFLQPLYYTNASSNDSHYSNPNFDKLVNEANAESDVAKSVSTFQDAEKVLAQDFPVVPLWYQNGTAGYSKSVSNVALDPFSVPVYTGIEVSE
ncbi:peptide ABC transporter substrate-binding protein [Wenjunlia tyrosinilytica]|uniref:Peptide ABC transporter substrate-binding protein n=1 Tax=Wenjunlia tyrosinilytica TaxID=1544741 RepID=A0A917ZNQ3_9ACTN|nr:ABC transporter substrate-binding protein [Wenjunlia tyrosinilytica]GGO85985.1 peptide ABC transporter substrate-binding protein [Wenjunlia tyrosinilytica]